MLHLDNDVCGPIQVTALPNGMGFRTSRQVNEICNEFDAVFESFGQTRSDYRSLDEGHTHLFPVMPKEQQVSMMRHLATFGWKIQSKALKHF